MANTQTGFLTSNQYIAFNPVRESKENLFSSNLMPLPPKFAFQERTGRINWRMIMNTDLDRLNKDCDLKQLENLLQNITFAQIDRDDLERLGDAHFIKLFRLSQYSIEYLLYSQGYLESLCKSLDLEYKVTYEKTMKTEDAIKKYQSELKMMRKELKLKQKTLSTYEYLMKLPTEQEQEVIKCKRCPKFFLSKGYLQKHYLKNHPQVDFEREFSDQNFNENSINDRAQTIQQVQPQINQEELFDKIKTELFVSLTQNFQKIEGELKQVKEKQNFKQIQDMLQNYEHKNEEEQKKIQDSLQKPAKMLEELKNKWGDLFQQQTIQMRDMISSSVNEALVKRKEEREKRKVNNKSGDMSSNDGAKDQRVKYYESKVNELDEKFKENEKAKQALEARLREYERMLQEKNQSEQDLQQKLQEEQVKRSQIERERIEREKLMEQAMKEKLAVEEAKLKEEERKLREEHAKKLEQEQQLIKQNEEKKRKELQKEQEIEKQNLLMKQKELEEKQKQLEIDKKKAEEESKRREEEQEKVRKAQELSKILAPKPQIEIKKGPTEQTVEEIVVVEEEVEEEDSDIDEELKRKEEQQALANKKRQVIKESFKKQIKNAVENDSNRYEGNIGEFRSIFHHTKEEIKDCEDELQIRNIQTQDLILQKEIQTQKIQPQPDKTSQLSSSRQDQLRNVNDSIRGLQKRDAQKISNSLQKRLSDEDYAKYNGLIEAFLRKTLK